MQASAVKLNRGNVALWIVGAFSLLLVGIFVAGYDLWYQANYYVSTDYAQVVGAITEVVAPGAARVSDLHVKLGTRVEAGQSVASLSLAGPSADGSAQELVAERGGVVVGVYARDGQLAFAGQPIAALADAGDLWVVANVSESALQSIQVGQPAEVQVVVLDETIPGRIVEILPEAERVAAGGADTSARTVPVRIALDEATSGLLPGMAAYVKIRIR